MAILKRMSVAAIAGLLIGALCFGTFLLANYHSPGRGGAHHIASAFETGNLGGRDYIRGDTRIGQHQFTDRMFVWTIASGFALALALIRRHGSATSEQKPHAPAH